MPTRLRKLLLLTLGPVGILPLGIFVFLFVTRIINYSPPEVTLKLEEYLFLQGNTDEAGGMGFAIWVSSYIFFGITASIYLTLKLEDRKLESGITKELFNIVQILWAHIVIFLLVGLLPVVMGYDTRVTPNDFRNMFLFVATIYCLTVFLVAVLRKLSDKEWVRLVFAPTFIFIWLIIGADGNTLRAGQLVQAGQDPKPVIRGIRHGIMMSWHRLCDNLLGEIRSDSR